MKKILISLGFAATTIFAAQAQETPQEPQEKTPGTELSQDNRREIKESELPESVQMGLQDSEYAELDVVRIYEATTDEGMIVYEIAVFDGTNEATVQFDESGNIKEGQEDQTQPREFEQGTGQELEQGAQEAEHEVEHKVTESGEVEHEVKSKTGEEMRSESESIEGEGIKEISEADIPQEVKDALKNDTDYKNATIEQAFVLTGAALSQALDEVTTDSTYGEDYEKMYQLQVGAEDNKSSLIYITEEGEVFAEKEM